MTIRIAPLALSERPILKTPQCLGCGRRGLAVDGILFCRWCRGVRQVATGIVVPMHPAPRTLLYLLLTTRPRMLEKPEMIEFLWPDPDLQPVSAGPTVGVYMVYLRAAGFNVVSNERKPGAWTVRTGGLR